MTRLVAKRKPNKHGRANTYDTMLDEIAQNLAFMGLTNQEIGKAFGVSKQALETWMSQHPHLSECIHRGRDIQCADVAGAMYRSAMGYKQSQQRPFVDRNGEKVVVDFIETIPADPGSQARILAARGPECWRKSGNMDSSTTPQELSINFTVVPDRKIADG